MKEVKVLREGNDFKPNFACFNCQTIWEATLDELIKSETTKMGENVVGYYFICPKCGEKYWYLPYRFKEN